PAGGAGGPASDDDDPLHAGHKAAPTHTATADDSASSTSSSDSSSSNVSGGVTVTGKAPKVFIILAGGTGAGFVTGETEQQNNKVECCFAPDLAHVNGEIGF